MSQESLKPSRILLPCLLIACLALMALVGLSPRSWATPSREEIRPLDITTMSLSGQGLGSGRPRNLSLQPEALKLSRKLGQRFMGARRDVSVMLGYLSLGSEQRGVQMIRRQSEGGESVEIVLAGHVGPLTWDAVGGSKSNGLRVTGSERELIERLVFDSADQFVLAQLRGASYYTVARNVRPAEAGESDGYAGPLWTIVRVNDPEQDGDKRPESSWRLYYINATTGLIDKIVSEVRGATVEAIFSRWTSDGSEQVPFEVTWNQNGQTVMKFNVINFARPTAQ